MQRQPNRRRQQPNRRRQGRQNNQNNRPNFRANANSFGAGTASRPDLLSQKRVFTREIGVSLSHISGNQRYHNWFLDDYLARYQGSEYMTSVYDQYKCDRIEVFMRASLKNCGSQAHPVSSQNSAMYDTIVTSVIDFDNTSPMTYEDALSYTNAKTQKLRNGSWVRVANYAPRIKAGSIGQIATTSTPQWLDSAFQNVSHLGYNALIKNDNGGEYFNGTTATSSQYVHVKVRGHFSFRGRRSTSTNTVTSKFFDDFIGSTVTITTPASTRTVSTWRQLPVGGSFSFEYQYVGSTVWHTLEEILSIIRNGELTNGNPATYDGPRIPLFVSNPIS